jgi:hypothetical protein
MNTRDTRLQPLQGEANATGLAHLYRLLLGREAEPAVLAAAQPRPLQALVGEMAASAEIDRTVLHALVQQRQLPHEALDAARLAEAGRWFAAVAEGRDTTAAPPAEPPAAAQVLAGVLGHPVVSACLLDAHGSLFTEAWLALQARARQAALRLAGRIEFANQECISGWALRQGVAAAGPLLIEIRHQGRLVASAVACSHRPDIQRRLGGDGLVGFRARWQPAALPAGGPVMLTLHDAASGTAIGEAYRHENSMADQLGVAQLLAREFDELQRRLDALAGLVPQALGYAALPLARFDLYRRLHRVPAPPARGATPAPTVAVLLDASRAGPGALRTSVDSLRALAPGVPWRAWVLANGGDTAAALAAAAVAEPRWRAKATRWPGWPRRVAPNGCCCSTPANAWTRRPWPGWQMPPPPRSRPAWSTGTRTAWTTTPPSPRRACHGTTARCCARASTRTQCWSSTWSAARSRCRPRRCARPLAASPRAPRATTRSRPASARRWCGRSPATAASNTCPTSC